MKPDIVAPQEFFAKSDRTRILGIPVSPVNLSLAVQIIDQWIQSNQRDYVCVRDVNGLIECLWDWDFFQIHENAGLVTPDGMPLVWLSRLRGQKHVRRVYGPDLMIDVCADSETKGYRHFFYGGAPGVAEELVENLKRRFPLLQVAGTYAPPFRPLTPEEDAEVVTRINGSQAQIVWVGLGTPKQEYWMRDHLGKLNAQVMLGVGAAFDFHAGVKKVAPAWMKRAGLEWFFRLMTEPRRLARRYLIRVPLFLALATWEQLGGKVRPRQPRAT